MLVILFLLAVVGAANAVNVNVEVAYAAGTDVSCNGTVSAFTKPLELAGTCIPDLVLNQSTSTYCTTRYWFANSTTCAGNATTEQDFAGQCVASEDGFQFGMACTEMVHPVEIIFHTTNCTKDGLNQKVIVEVDKCTESLASIALGDKEAYLVETTERNEYVMSYFSTANCTGQAYTFPQVSSGVCAFNATFPLWRSVTITSLKPSQASALFAGGKMLFALFVLLMMLA